MDEVAQAKCRPPIRLARMITAAFLIAGVCWSVYTAVYRVGYPFPLDYTEGPSLDRAAAVAGNAPLYPPIGQAPFVAWVYTPLYAWLYALGVGLFGATYLVGRALSAAAAVAAAVLIYVLTRRETRSRAWGAVGALLFLGNDLVVLWGTTARVDMLRVAFGLGGLVALNAGVPPAVAGILFALAVLCKQSLVGALGAACLFLALSRRGRDLTRLLIACAGIVVSVGAWQMWATGGWFWHHTVTANSNAWSLHQLLTTVPAVVRYCGMIASIGIAGILVVPRGKPPAVQACYLLTAGATGLLAGKVGSNTNYWLDFVAAASVAAATYGQHLSALQRDRARAGYWELGIALLLILHTGFATPSADTRTLAEELPRRNEVVDILTQAGTPVLTEDPGLAHVAGHAIWFQPFEFTQMALAGRWNPAPLLAMLSQGQFTVVALEFDPSVSYYQEPGGTWHHARFSDEMVAAIKAAYHVDRQLGSVYILVPRRTTPPPGGLSGGGNP